MKGNLAGPVRRLTRMRWWILGMVLIAACGQAADPVPADGGNEPLARVDILTGPNSGMEALGTFTLEYDAVRNCLFWFEEDNNGEPGTGGRNVIVWPSGYSAVADGDTVTVLDADGNPVASTGKPFQLAGGSGRTDGHCDAIGAWYANGAPIPVP